MFAHNEEKNILASVQSILDNSNEYLKKLHIIANGCNDKTIPILQKLQVTESAIDIIDLTIGDKCNAWNHYIYNIAPSSNVDIHFFVDADVSFTPLAFPKLCAELSATPEAVAIAGLPMTGRNKKLYQDLVVNGVCLFGNLYGINNTFAKHIKSKNFKLPIGLSWIDSAITKMINCNITNQYKGIHGRITHLKGTGYTFNSLIFFKPSDIKLYFNRIARYELGKLQERELNKLEFNEWPATCGEINANLYKEITAGKIKVKMYLKHLIIKKLKNDTFPELK